MKYLKTLLWMVAFFFAIHFSMQNREEITLRYVFFTGPSFEITQVPLFLIILCSIFIGVFIGGAGGLYARLKMKRILRYNQKTIERLEKENRKLQNLDSGLSPPSDPEEGSLP
jgi:uncharacterized integral membrane protein